MGKTRGSGTTAETSGRRQNAIVEGESLAPWIESKSQTSRSCRRLRIPCRPSVIHQLSIYVSCTTHGINTLFITPSRSDVVFEPTVKQTLHLPMIQLEGKNV